MKLLHPTPKKMSLLFSLLLLVTACSKDADLLSDYVIAKDGNLQSISFLVDDQFFIGNGQSSILMDVLNNDNFDSDVQVSIVETSLPQNGDVIINADNTLTYTPQTVVTPPEETPTPEESAQIPVEDTFTYTTEVTTSDNEISRQEATVTVTTANMGKLKAFPLAYGAGAYSVGGRGQNIYKVTNLNDSGPGSLRDALSQGNRTIVFEVSGTIELNSEINANINNVTIAGQTAPIGGITITGRVMNIQGNNIIIRYIRVRPDFDGSQRNDVINTTRLTNSIFDHLSLSWGGDEVVSLILDSNNNTIQNCLFAESRTGQIMGNSENPSTGGDFSVLRNAYYNISHRFPNPVTDGRADVINNFIYNYNFRLMTFSPSTNVKLNWIGNYMESPCGQNKRINDHQVNWIDHNSTKSEKIYASGNLLMPFEFTNADSDNKILFQYRNPPSGTGAWQTISNNYFVSNPFPLIGEELPVINSNDVKTNILNDVGARWILSSKGEKIEDFDSIDERYLNHMNNSVCFSYTWIQDYSIYPHYKLWHSNVNKIPLASHPNSRDSDNDGMPDEWEVSRFGNLSRDGKGDINGDGYTDLEEFLNLVDF